jgi:hypothetical protein
MQVPSLLLLFLVQASADPGAIRARETAYARVTTAQRIAADPELQKAVEARNAAGESAVEIRRKDKEWQANPKHPLRTQLRTGACADRLRQQVAADAIVVEAFLMDDKGALVCATHETSDYWQGDEAKWQRTFGEGKEVFVDEPALDESSGVYAVQLSALVRAGKRRLGALTLTLKVPR